MARAVIVAYRPKPDGQAKLLDLVRQHHPLLLAEKLITSRPPFVMQSKTGEVIEVFEWLSEMAIQDAHDNPRVQALWRDMAEVADTIPVAQVTEAQSLFSEFSPLSLLRDDV
ncbi:hypothetical protein LJ739_01680 [Aestuariibacter halophilus]|uniref:ABM domain-containing protein n=1 Tax=Fluctibacter halophilus TaxID=226011 RepID=A0ABS8G5J8_9ALTE|nr:hypothetical protein [Aestuariibacter halophilus]MCC2614949.1 hypothetical protein [Aestuariibacter halophilus]